MKKIFLSLFLLLSTVVFALAPEDITMLAHDYSTEYIHAYQDMKLILPDTFGTNITVNIGELVTIFGSNSACNIIDGSPPQLLTANIYYDSGVWTVMFVVNGINVNFEQGSQYTITVDIGDGSPAGKTVTFNKEYVIGSVTINANSKYREQKAGGKDYFKAGLNNSYADANLSVTGTVHYRYDSGVFPTKNVSRDFEVELYVSNNYYKVSIGENGLFVFNSLSIPTTSEDFVDDIIISVDIDGAILHSDATNISYFTVDIDNKFPDLGGAYLSFIVASESISEGTTIVPIDGYFNRSTVSYVLKNSVSIDDTKSGISSNIWVVDPFNSLTGFFTPISEEFIVTFAYNNQTMEGSKELVIYVFDNVYNYVTVSVRVTIDITPPNEFVVTIQPDIDNTLEQLSPELGWYNDQTVSFSWAVPVDDSEILAYQFKSEGWNTWSAFEGTDIVEGVSQASREAWVTVNEGGDTARKVWVRAIDKAGNIKIAYTTVKVDTTIPTVSLLLAQDNTGKENVLVNILPQIGWYNDVNVKWFCGAEDSGQLRDKAFKYRYLMGDSNTGDIDWVKLGSEITVTPSAGTTNNIFMLSGVDKAGNIGTVTAQIYVDLVDPVPVNLIISFSACSLKGEGVQPEPLWYNQTTVDLFITWDSVIEYGELYKVMLYVGQTSVPTIHIISESNESISFNNISFIANDATPINFKALLVDKAGNFKEINDFIYSDIVTPNDFQVVLASDSDSRSDGLDPEENYYDNPELTFMIMFSQADPTARNRPFQFRVNNNSWGDPTSNLYITNFSVSANACNVVETRYMDKAGNVLTSSFRVTVDTLSPSGSFTLGLITCDYISLLQVTPDVGWYNKSNVSFNFVVVGNSIFDTFDIRENGYYLKGETDPDFPKEGQTNSKNANITVANGGALQRTIVGAIADKAGNMVRSNANVFVDTDSPATNFEARILPDSDPGNDGIWPEVGWHATPWININWDQANDGAGSLQTNPYRVRSDGTPTWSAFQYALNYSGIYVIPSNNNTQNVYIQIRDKAGNLATKSVNLKVDTTDPVIALFVSPQIPLEGVTYNIFKQLYGDDFTFPLSGWLNTENLTLTWNVVLEEGGFPSVSFRVKSTANVEYGTSLNRLLRQTQLVVSASNHTTIDLFIKAWDNAGNSTQTTTGIKVDIIPPLVTLNMKSRLMTTVMPFVSSQDTLMITLNISEPISVTPFVCYVVTDGSKPYVTINNVIGSGTIWSCSLNMNSVSEDGSHLFKVFLIDDAGNIVTGVRGYTSFVKLASEEVPSPQRFFAQDMETRRTDLTNAYIVSVSFVVGTSINKYLILEGEDAASANIAKDKIDEWKTLLPTQCVVDNGALQYSLQYTFPSGLGYTQNEVRRLYLWVEDINSKMTMVAVTCDIILDKIVPLIKIRPSKENSSQEGSVYEGYRLAKSVLYTAQMEITHSVLFSGDGYRYFEKSVLTPSWKLVIKNGDGSPVTESMLIPVLPKYIASYIGADATDSGNSAYKAFWWADFNLVSMLLGRAPATYDAYFEVIVTDEARNVTSTVVLGSHFIVDTNIPPTPIFSAYSWDGRSSYSNSLTINFMLSKTASTDTYYKYSIKDNTNGRPYASDYIGWPTVSSGQFKVSFDGTYVLTDTSQGRKDLKAWVEDEYQTNCAEAAEWSITYDSLSPTCTILIQPLNSSNYIVVTMFCNELLDLTQKNTILVEGGGVLQTATITLNGKINNEYIYIASISKGTSLNTLAMLLDKYISINVVDLAGNNYTDRFPFLRQLQVLGYTDYFVRARQQHLTGYDTNSLEVGRTAIPIILAELKAVSRDVHLLGANLQFYQMGESKIEKFYIYVDTDRNGLFDKNIDTLVGEKVYQGIGDTMNIAVDEQIVNFQTTTTIFLVVDVYAGADYHVDNVGFGFVTKDPFNVSFYESVNAPSSQQSNGIVATFNITKTILNVSYIIPKDEAASVTSSVHAGQRIVVKKFALRSWPAGGGVGGVYGALWTGVTLKVNSDTMQPNKVTRVAIYRDNGSGLFYDDPSLLVSSGQDRFEDALQRTINIVFPYPQNVGGNDPAFFIVVDTDKSLEYNKAFSFEISSADSFVFRDNDKMVDYTKFPAKTITFNADYYISQILVDYYKNIERYVSQKAELNVLKFKLNVDYKGSESLPRIYYFDVSMEYDGTVNDDKKIKLNDDVDILLYKYSGSNNSDDFSYTNKIQTNVLDGTPQGERVRVLITESSNPPNQQTLLTENYYALIIKPRENSVPGREGFFKIKFVNSDNEAGNISFQGEDPAAKAYGRIINEQVVTTNMIQIVNRFQPTKPVISGNAYTANHSNVRFYYSTSVNIQNSGVDSLRARLGTTVEGSEIFNLLLSVNNVNSYDIQLAEVSIPISKDKYLNDDTTYNISLKARATDGTNEYWSITGDFYFHTDFTPPWVGNDNKLHVIAKWDENRHDIVWSPFIEAQSRIEYYIVEMLSGQSLNWEFVTRTTTIREWSNYDVKLDTPYQYRVKAVNAAGLPSLYLDSGDRIMTTNTTEVIFNVSNYPNPFYSAFYPTRIVFSLNQDIDASITIYDSMGHFVRRYDSKQITKEGVSNGSGYFCYIDWDGRNESGQFVSKGGYFAVIEAAPYASGGKPTKVVRMIGVIH